MQTFEDLIFVSKFIAIRDINRTYWGEIHDMCEGTVLEFEPWRCVRLNVYSKVDGVIVDECVDLTCHPDFSVKELLSVDFALSIKDGLPVFKGENTT